MMTSKKGLSLRAPAKLNLYLKVGKKRSDGYHEIDSLVQMIDLHDTICLEPLDKGIEFVQLGRAVDPRTGENLVVRAANMLKQASGVSEGVRIFLRKEIPVGGGLGGGSSDAAATLVGLNWMWRLRWPRQKLFPLAAQLGSDVPLFLSAATTRVRGRGDILQEASFDQKYWVVLIFPGVEVSTAWAYSRLDQLRFALTTTDSHININRFETERGGRFGRIGMEPNDLEAVTFSAFPKVQRAKESLVRYGAELSRMSGSGSSVFGLFTKKASGNGAMVSLQDEWGKGNVWLCRPLKHSPLNTKDDCPP